MPVVAGRCDTFGTGRVRHNRLGSYLQVEEGTERVIEVVDVIKLLFEREEITTFKNDVSAAHFRTMVRKEFFD